MELVGTLASSLGACLKHRDRPLLVAICGWADTGKSTLAGRLRAELIAGGIPSDAISTDDFMRDRAERYAMGINGYDPRSLHVHDLVEAIRSFLNQRSFTVRSYDNRTGSRSPEARTVLPAKVLMVEGIHSLHPSIAELIGLKVFVDSDEETLRHMRYRANLQKRGMTPDEASARISSEWQDYCAFVRPRVKIADIVVKVDSSFHYHSDKPLHDCVASLKSDA